MIPCTMCDKLLQRRNIHIHMKFVHLQHDFSRPHQEVDGYVMDLPAASWRFRSTDRFCSRIGCPYTASSNSALRYHFARMHPKDTLIGMDEALQKCPKCGVFIRGDMSLTSHWRTQVCSSFQKRNERVRVNTSNKWMSQHELNIDNVTLERVPDFKYIGRMMTDTNDDWLTILFNIKKDRKRWACISKLLRCFKISRTYASTYYKVVVLTVLLYGSETWVISGLMWQKLRSFNHSIARSLSHIKGQKTRLQEHTASLPFHA